MAPVYPSTQRPLRNRALVVAFVKLGKTPPKYMLVRHRPTQEWGLLSGTCTRGEKPLNCAMRELREETRDAVVLAFTPYNTRSTVIIWPEGNVRYHVYFVDLTNYRSPTALRAAFQASKRTSSAGYDETDMLTFETLDELRDRKKVWEVTRFMVRQAEFQRLHRELCASVTLAPHKVLNPARALVRKSPPRGVRRMMEPS